MGGHHNCRHSEDVGVCCSDNHWSAPECPRSRSRSCSAHPSCYGLAGDCCPNAHGVYLGCCTSASVAVASVDGANATVALNATDLPTIPVLVQENETSQSAISASGTTTHDSGASNASGTAVPAARPG